MIKLPPIMDYREAEKHVISPKNKEWFAQGANWMRAEVQRLNATAQPVSDGWVKCSERMPPVKTAIIVGKWNGRLWATKWATYIPSHPESNSFGYIMPGGSWEPDFWMEVPTAPGGQDD